MPLSPTVVDLGLLPIASGRMAILDPGCGPHAGPVVALPPGRYRVLAYRAPFAGSAARTWQLLALLEGWAPGSATPLHIRGHLGVETGLASLADAADLERLADWDEVAENVLAGMARTGYEAACGEPAEGLVMAWCTAGLGDGAYPVHVLADAAGRSVGVACLFIEADELGLVPDWIVGP